MSKGWIDVLEKQISQLELIATWASMVNYGSVRDHIRLAIADLKKEIDRIKEMDKP